MDREAFAATAQSIGLALTDRQLDAFADFEEKLYLANEVKNFTRVPRKQCWLRHFIDSLLVQSLLPAGATVLDIGSGPGLPAWPLACARPDLQVTALDSNAKMLGFLEQVPLSNLVAQLGRAEEGARREAFDVVTGRALAKLPIQLEVSAALCKVGGVVIPLRTGKDELIEVPELGLRLEAVERRQFEGLDGERVFPVYRKAEKTPPKFPRRWAEILKKPLTGITRPASPG